LLLISDFLIRRKIKL